MIPYFFSRCYFSYKQHPIYPSSLTVTISINIYFTQIHPNTSPHIALVVSPLRSLMMDQVMRCQQMGIKATALLPEIAPDDAQAVKAGEMSVIFGSPESLVPGSSWLKVLKNHEHKICLLAYDEVHCLKSWGDDFRPDYLETVDIQSMFRAPTLGLTATMDMEVYEETKKVLHIDNPHIVSALPDRPNIFLDIVHKHGKQKYDVELDLQWIVDGLKEKQLEYPKTLIFTKFCTTVNDIFEFILDELGDAAFVGTKSPENRILSKYTGRIGKQHQTFNIECMKKPNSTVRALVCTIAFGMGVEIPDIKQVIHWGGSKSVLGHWQEIGRAGRDGGEARAIWYPKSTGGKDSELFGLLKGNEKLCVRKTILEHFLLPGMDNTSLQDMDTRVPCAQKCTQQCQCQLCKCCSHCANVCGCNKVD